LSPATRWWTARAAEPVFSAGPVPDAEAAGGAGRPLRLTRAGRRIAAGSSDAALDPMLRVYLSDMVRPYGRTMRDDLPDKGAGQSYGEMAGALLADIVPAGQPVDLIVVAFAIHDVIPGRSTANHLSYLCPGRPQAFAICDQGAAAPFTGLRLLRDYTGTGTCERALLVVAEQATLHYTAAAADAVPDTNAAVVLAFGPAGPGCVTAVREQADVAAQQVGDLLAGELAALFAGDTDVTLVAGNGLTRALNAAGPPGTPPRPAGVPPAVRLLAAPAGQPCTGVWWELAGRLPGWLEQGQRVLLADYDPALRYLCVAAIDVEAGPAATPQQHAAPRAQPAR